MKRPDAALLSLLALLASSTIGGCVAPVEPTDEKLAARCVELANLFEKYRIRTNLSLIGPDMTRLGASIDCAKGHYARGIKALEELLQRNRIPIPNPPVGG